MFLSLESILGPLGAPHGRPQGTPRGPERVYDESNDIRHVGYQFYSILSTENESRDDRS